jgi:hypothetical protein
MERRGLPRLMLRFPSSREDLKRLYLSDPLFQSLCAAYEDAYEQVKIREQAMAALTDELSDYRCLVGDIESDVCALLPVCSQAGSQRPATSKTALKWLAGVWRSIF